MNRLIVSISFQHENTRSLRIVGIVFDNDCPGETVDDVANKDPVRGELLITVIRHTDLAARHQRTYLIQGLAQFLGPFRFLMLRSGASMFPLEVPLQPRRLRIAPAHVGRKRWLGGPLMWRTS